MNTTFKWAILLGMATLAFGCKKDDPSEPAERTYYFTGNVNGTAVSWQVDNAGYKMSMAPYNSNNVSTSNHYIRYGTSIWTNGTAQQPCIWVEFSGFVGNAADRLTPGAFAAYFHTGSYPYSTAANQDTAIGVNIAYERNNNYLNMHQTATMAQPGTSSFSVDSLEMVDETNKTRKAYLKISFNATLHDPDEPGSNIVITNGVLRVLIDNFLEE